MPSSVSYGSLYAGDMHVMPSSARHPMTTPRGHTSTTLHGVPTTTRTYTVTQDPQSGRSVVPREASRTRRSTMDSSSRPPVIVTTRQTGQQPHQASHSPVRHAPRASDGHLHAQPASSIRSRSQAAPYHRTHESEDYSRGRERDRTEAALAARDAEAYRSSRPSVVYQADPRHTTPAVSYNDGDFSYTNAGELARYDLDHSRPSRHRRRESLDRGYHRPNVSYNADSRSFNVNTSADLSRNYTMNTSRPYDGHTRGGPPPSTRGFDKLDRSFDSARDAPPQTPVTASTTTLRPRETEPKRERPVSLYQEAIPRSSHHDDYYRSREDERNMRELRDRDRESERVHDPPSYQDESVTSRGFGIKTAPVDDYDDRRDRKRESYEPRKRSDEEVAREADLERERRRRSHLDDKVEPRRRSDEDLPSDRDRRRRSRLEEVEPRKRSDESLTKDYDSERRRAPKDELRDRRDSRRDDGDDRTRLRDKIVSGVGVAAAAVGLTGASSLSSKEKDQDEGRDREPRRRRSPTESRDKRDDERDRYAERPKEREFDREKKDVRDRDYERERKDSRDDAELKERHRRDAEARLGGDAPASGSDSEKPRRQPPAIGFNPNDASDITKLREQLNDRREDRREPVTVERSSLPAREPVAERSSAKEESRTEPRSAGGFNPNDAGDISRLREQLAAMGTNDKDKPREKERGRSDQTVVESRVSRSTSPPGQPRRSESHERERSRGPRGREMARVGSDEKTVRVVSPPRDKNEDKPIKGILKQPSERFPEEQNFVREGAAPHRDDKKAKDVPNGAKWTKISRKIVNPEALTVGKERFEVRDDFVIVLRVLDKEEIQAYAAATQVLRGTYTTLPVQLLTFADREN